MHLEQKIHYHNIIFLFQLHKICCVPLKRMFVHKCFAALRGYLMIQEHGTSCMINCNKTTTVFFYHLTPSL